MVQSETEGSISLENLLLPNTAGTVWVKKASFE